MLWQHHAGLAVGVSAHGAAITLACTMLGLAVGASVGGRLLARRPPDRPIRVYGLLEAVIGVSGLLLPVGFDLLARADGWAWRVSPVLAPVVQALGIIVLLGIPTVAMGATVPLFAVIARRRDTSIGRLYGLNTAGAAVGVLASAFILLPEFGVALTGAFMASVDLAVAAGAWLIGGEPASANVASANVTSDADAAAAAPDAIDGSAGPTPVFALKAALAAAAVTGGATFVLEVAWFRALRAAFQSTTDSFALMLFAVLGPLALGARIAVRLPARRAVVGTAAGVAGVLVLIATPIIERADLLAPNYADWWMSLAIRLGVALALMGPAVVAIGVVFPWLMERRPNPGDAGRLYAANTLSAVAGSLVAGWILLPILGFAATAWLAGVALAALGVALSGPGRARTLTVAVAVAALLGAVAFETGLGRIRVLAPHVGQAYTVVSSREGPDASVVVIELHSGDRELLIDGFQASGEARTGHYMAWMGRLPMLLRGPAERAMVICFGTGQTANALRREVPDNLDIVELSGAVIASAGEFASNEGVLDDERVRTVVMDGRAWLRRTTDRYDVVTLEPMAPYFAGTNSLYSREFYALVAGRLAPGGVVAQWLPLHLVSPRDAASIAATFVDALPDSHLWLDPVDGTGILVGRSASDSAAPGPGPPALPGLSATSQGRDLTPAAVRAGFALDPPGLVRFASLGEIVTDDNQQLSYGNGRREKGALFGSNTDLHRFNLEMIRRAATDTLR